MAASEQLFNLTEQFKALGHPHRLQIFVWLASSCQGDDACTPRADGTLPCTGDLASELDLPPSTLSHHLKELEVAGLITRRREGTTIRCGIDPSTLDSLADFFAALSASNAANSVSRSNPPMSAEPPLPPLRVLVLCTGNSCRSQMAEGLLRHRAAEQHISLEPHSAGLEPRPVHPLAIQVMSELGIDISGHTSKSLRDYLGKKVFATVIVVCAETEAACPRVFPFAASHEFWPFDDPATFDGSEADTLDEFRRIRDQIDASVQEWLARIPV